MGGRRTYPNPKMEKRGKRVYPELGLFSGLLWKEEELELLLLDLREGKGWK